MKNAQVKSISWLLFMFIMTTILIYAVSTNLITPSDNSIDNDGSLDLRGSCEPTSENSYDGTTTWNITNATLYTNIGGDWKANQTLHGTDGSDSNINSTLLFNFSTDLIGIPENEYQWNIQCNENNISDNTVINKAFAGNKTIRVRYARPIITSVSPADQSYDLDGQDINITCSASASSNWNITRVDLLSSTGTGYSINQSFTPTPLTGATVVANFTHARFPNASLPDGTDLIFSCSATQQTNDGAFVISSEKSSTNRTINVEYPPEVTLNSPPDANWSKSKRFNINFTTVSAFGTGVSPFTCQVFTNESGNWVAETGGITANNNTGKVQQVVLLEKSQIAYGVKCHDGNDGNVFNFSVNRTIKIDATNPTISVSTENTTQDDTVTITFTPTDANLNNVDIYTNYTGTWKSNYTNTSAFSGVAITATTVTIADGFYVYSVRVNDSAGRFVETDNFSITVDTLSAGVSGIRNSSEDGSCSSRFITWNTTEATNFTFYYDTDTEVTDGTILTNSTKATSHKVALEFGTNDEIDHFFNITVEDEAGNSGTSNQTTFLTPLRVCSGWSQYAVYDTSISLSDLENQTGAELIYFWNQTDQTWIFKTRGLSSNGDTVMGFNTDYHVVHVFEDVNSTWFRETNNQGLYNYNVTSINNFISIPTNYHFGNLSETFLNVSNDFPAILGSDTSSVPNGTTFLFNVTSFAGYNNTVQDYVNHIYNFTWENSTVLQPCTNRLEPATCMETFWVGSAFNVTWNGTGISGNWSV